MVFFSSPLRHQFLFVLTKISSLPDHVTFYFTTLHPPSKWTFAKSQNTTTWWEFACKKWTNFKFSIITLVGYVWLLTRRVLLPAHTNSYTLSMILELIVLFKSIILLCWKIHIINFLYYYKWIEWNCWKTWPGYQIKFC